MSENYPLTLEILERAINKAKEKIPNRTIDAFLVSRLVNGYFKAEYDGKNYIIMSPANFEDIRRSAVDLPNLPAIACLCGIPVYEDDELAKKIIIDALTK